MKKIIAAVLSAVMCLSFFIGCSEEVLPEPGPKDVIYKFSEFNPEGFNYDVLVGFAYDNDMVYMLTQKTEAGEGVKPGTVENYYLLKTDISGNIIEKQLLSSATEEQKADIGYKYYSGLGIGKDNEIYLVRQTALNTARPKTKLRFSIGYDPRDPEGKNNTDEEPLYKTEIISLIGNTETVAADVSGKLETYGVDTSSLFVSAFEIDKDDLAYMTINTDSVWVFDLSTGEIVFDNKPIPQDGNIRGFYKNENGEMCVVSFKQMVVNEEAINKLIIVPINPKTNKFGKEEVIDAPDGGYSNIAPGDDRFSNYGFSSKFIYGYKKENRTLVADLSGSGVRLSEITRLIPASDTTFLITGYTLDTIGLEKLYSLAKVDPKNVPDKSILTVASVSDPSYIDGYITEFKLTHPQIQVEYKRYSVTSNTSYDDALTAFNNDIIAGNISDVIIINREMPYGNYVRKGMLADLYPFIDNDSDYGREDFLQPILKAFETDGKLYSIAPAFQFDTLVGKTSIFGEEQGQSFAKLQDVAAQIPGANLFGSAVNRDVFTDEILTRMAGGFIDDEKGVCNFDSPRFISLLEYAKSLPAPAQRDDTPDAKPYELSFAPGETNDYKTDKTLIELLSVWDFRHIVSLEKMEFGEPVTFLGFPNDSGGSGILARPRLETAIMAQAKNPDGAWEFVKGLFTYGDYYVTHFGYPPLARFPVLMSELVIAAEKTTIPPYETWEGERIPRLNWFGPNLSNQPDNTDADNAKMFALFESIEGIERSVPAIENIISEETASYFAGKKSAEETASIIQNRATTYLEEQK
jgi:ABC-type glycerol-3-phosphate transport system substrate-binding protein